MTLAEASHRAVAWYALEALAGKGGSPCAFEFACVLECC
jgi:hypothetical protein